MKNELYESYVKQIQRYKLLSAEQEIELSKKVQSGDEKARMDLIQSNLRLVVSVANKFATAKVSVMDLIQEGNIGLMTAASKYHYSFKTRFSTYAYSWIMQYMLRYLHNKTALIALPHRKDEMIRRIESARSYLFQKIGREPSESELAVYMGIDESEIEQVMSYSYQMSSLDVECGDDSSMSVADLLPDTTYSPESVMMKEIRRNEIHELVAGLSEPEQQVIYHRFNFGYERRPKTLREISEMLGVSAETVRQMEIRAIRRMQLEAKNASKQTAVMA